MFDGVPEQFHQFIASRTSVPLPLSFPLHGSTQTNFPNFDPFPSHQTLQLQSHLLPHLHHPPPPPLPPTTTHKEEEKEQQSSFLSTSLELERERSVSEAIDPWSNDEVLALLRIRSSMENWFPDFTWEHVSRKLSELGFKRSAERCKEKFEEESRHFDNMSTYTKNYRFFSELEELCHGDHQNPNKVLSERNQNVEKLLPNKDSRSETTNSSQENEKKPSDKKRKRHKRFQMLKGFCEEVVKKMMAQQEELHNKLIEDMVKKDEEKIAREEAWKRVEMERINKEIDIMAQEQAIASDRQSKLIEFLKKFTPNSSENSENVSTSPSLIQPQNPKLVSQNPSSETLAPPQNPSSKLLNSSSQNPSNTQKNPLSPTSSSTQKTPQNPNLALNERDDIGKRWPRDEVLALINLRCSLNSGGGGGGGGEDKEGAKGPLWERISQGMFELGYKRNAKRCKEKWENINKYFRKTKDVNKKRSLDSRTCPYFHQLSSLYSQGTLVAPLDRPENCSSLPENRSDVSENCLAGPPQDGSGGDANMHVDEEGEKNLIQVPAFEFEF